MAKANRAARRDLEVMEFLRLGGRRISAGFAGKALAATKSLRRQQLGAAQGMRAEQAKLFGRLKNASVMAGNDPTDKRILEQILGLHRRLAAKKLRFPKVAGGASWISPGTISGVMVPPFEFADTIPPMPFGNPELSASANVNGQIAASAVTAESGVNNGSEYAKVGFFFHPMTQGTLTVSASPSYSFEWSTNSLNNAPVTSSGDVGLTVYGMNELAQILSTAGSYYKTWDQTATGLQFDFGFDLQNSLSVSLQVNPSQIYLCFVEVFAQVFGAGWPVPGSLASAMASASVPSMSFEFVPLAVAFP
jgi:hypothetical protein